MSSANARDDVVVTRHGNDFDCDLSDDSHDLACAHDLQGKLLTVNHALARLLGYSIQELLRTSMYELVAPEYRPVLAEYTERILKERLAQCRFVLLTSSGEWRTRQCRSRLSIDASGEQIIE